jgi:hypothetical protein
MGEIVMHSNMVMKGYLCDWDTICSPLQRCALVLIPGLGVSSLLLYGTAGELWRYSLAVSSVISINLYGHRCIVPCAPDSFVVEGTETRSARHCDLGGPTTSLFKLARLVALLQQRFGFL